MSNSILVQQDGYRIEMITAGPFQTNYFLLVDEQQSISWLFDCGFESSRIQQWVQNSGSTLQAIYLTHGHIDHVAEVEKVADAFGVPFYLHAADVPMLSGLAAQAQMFGLQASNVRHPDGLLEAGAIQFGRLACDARFTPGHSPGSISFYFPDLKVLFAGDTLFASSIGRTDLPGGNHAQLIDAIRTKILTLPPETQVFPGHMHMTSVGREAQSNPFLR